MPGRHARQPSTPEFLRISDGTLLKSLLVGLRTVADALKNGLNSGRDRGGRFLIGQVGGPDYPCHRPQCWVSQFVLLDQGFQGAASTPVAELRSANVEWHGVYATAVPRAGHELEGCVGIDEPLDRPGGRDPIHMNALTGDKAHQSTSTWESVTAGCFWLVALLLRTQGSVAAAAFLPPAAAQQYR